MEFIVINDTSKTSFPANPALCAGIHLPVRTGDGLCRVELVQLRRKAAAEYIRPRQRKSLMLALSQDMALNRPVEAKSHVRRFHETFLHLITRKGGYRKHIKRSLFLADKTAFNYYKDLAKRATTTG